MSDTILLAVGMGIVDGFNVCSLGALILIISMVMIFKSRRMIFLAGGTFIATTVVVYGALIFLWHKIFSYILPYQGLFQIIIGTLSLIGGLYFLKVFWDGLQSDPTCPTEENALITWATKKLQGSFTSASYLAIFSGTLLFASIVAIVEFPCSAAVPLVFVGMLADAGLSGFPMFVHVFLFLFFYTLDEIIVFVVAVWAKKLWFTSPKLVTYFSLVGALLLVSIALYYLFGWNILGIF